MRKASHSINYSQTWEDPDVLIAGLEISRDDAVLSITSGGDNVLAVMLQKPAKLVSIDLNPAQNHLLELKLAAIRNLNHDELVGFLGIRDSSERNIFFNRIKGSLSDKARVWWMKYRSLIEGGVIHAGRFEKFLKLFRSLVLPLIHSRKTVEAFLAVRGLEEQGDYYKKVWDTKRWRLLFRIFSSRFILRFARQPGMFRHATAEPAGEKYLKRLERNFRSIRLSANYFMNYCLTGSYDPAHLPVYLEEKNHRNLKESSVNPDIITGDLLSYLKSMPGNYFSKLNLSDVFEALSDEENIRLWTEIVRTAKPGARVAYWNNLVPRSFPEAMSGNLIDEHDVAVKIHAGDRVFFYGSFHINKIIK